MLWWALREKYLHTVVLSGWVDATHPSYTPYTSGTTGKPKGVPTHHLQLLVCRNRWADSG
jgi:acyl-coenzyme A synthetase/AMP-(fatty) acid ligase